MKLMDKAKQAALAAAVKTGLVIRNGLQDIFRII